MENKELIICLDAGHYGKYNQSPANRNYYESVAMWKLTMLQKKYLEEFGFKVILTRDNQELDLELTARGRKAKGCVLAISNHSNAVDSNVHEDIDYAVVYRLFDDTTTNCDDISEEIAYILAPVIAEVMETKQSWAVKQRLSDNDRNHDGIFNDNYYGFLHGARDVEVAALILEHSFHTNTRITNWLLDDNNLDKLAKAEAEAIAKYFGMDNKKVIQYTKYSKEEFIEKVAGAVNAIRKEFGIEVASPIIAQACLESAYGTTNKATHNNYFGLKYRENRCPSACGTFVDGSTEQLNDGTVVPITDQWFEFETLEKGIRGYFEYTSIDRYKELKGETDPKRYLEKIKAAGYATDHEYVNKVWNVITKYNLTKYDKKADEPKKEEVKKYYRVRKSWDDAKSQLGAYENLDYAKKDCPEGYSVYDWNGKTVYSNKKAEEPKKDAIVLEWQNAAIADGFEFPLYGADGQWGDECRGVAKVAIIKERKSDGKWVWKYPNLTKLAQRLLGFTGDDIDGKCGTGTGDRIEAHQKKRGLKPDRCIGLYTWEDLLDV